MILIQARPEGPDLYRPAYAVAEAADAEPEHSELVDVLCETVTIALARAREAGEAWVDAHAEPAV
ncbi:MAG: hypothetical protein EON47_21925 [Acetobacteraceae bacterium]|nr:MAG: hypothetical protein EON47_21925 [Acetobacteraceae bacterium]